MHFRPWRTGEANYPGEKERFQDMNSEQLAEIRSKEYRHGLVSAQIDVDLPLQIRSLRKHRGWTQPNLAEATGMKQPRISAMEKPGGARFNLETLSRLAEAFDVALIVRFAPFSELLDWSDKFNPDELEIANFEEELESGAFENQPSLNGVVIINSHPGWHPLPQRETTSELSMAFESNHQLPRIPAQPEVNLFYAEYEQPRKQSKV
jgi:transcriptional regulator with XRE-family HTH domain